MVRTAQDLLTVAKEAEGIEIDDHDSLSKVCSLLRVAVGDAKEVSNYGKASPEWFEATRRYHELVVSLDGTDKLPYHLR